MKIPAAAVHEFSVSSTRFLIGIETRMYRESKRTKRHSETTLHIGPFSWTWARTRTVQQTLPLGGSHGG